MLLTVGQYNREGIEKKIQDKIKMLVVYENCYVFLWRYPVYLLWLDDLIYDKLSNFSCRNK